MTGPSILSVGRAGDDYVAFLNGRATMGEGPAFHAFVMHTLDHAPEQALFLCIDACEYMDSTFLGSLISLHQKYSLKSPARFVVVASPESRTRLLASARLDLILKLDEQLPECGSQRVDVPTPPVGSTDFVKHAILCHQLLADIGGPQAATFQLVADQLSRDLNQ